MNFKDFLSENYDSNSGNLGSPGSPGSSEDTTMMGMRSKADQLKQKIAGIAKENRIRTVNLDDPDIMALTQAVYYAGVEDGGEKSTNMHNDMEQKYGP